MEVIDALFKGLQEQRKTCLAGASFSLGLLRHSLSSRIVLPTAIGGVGGGGGCCSIEVCNRKKSKLKSTKYSSRGFLRVDLSCRVASGQISISLP